MRAASRRKRLNFLRPAALRICKTLEFKMPATTRIMHRRRSIRRTARCRDEEMGTADMFRRKEILCDELQRIGEILHRLRHRRHVGPDVSTDDLLELFLEERERLLAQLREVDATLADEETEAEPHEGQVLEFRRSLPPPSAVS